MNNFPRRKFLKIATGFVIGASVPTLCRDGDKAEAQGRTWDVGAAQEVVELVYRQVLEREVDDSGFDSWTHFLVCRNRTTQEFVREIAYSSEYEERFVAPYYPNQEWGYIIQNMYRHFLDREPESQQVELGHSEVLVNRGYKRLARNIIYSNEYVNRWTIYGVPGTGPVSTRGGAWDRLPWRGCVA